MKITFKGLGPFIKTEEQTFKLKKDKINVIIGKNSSGKSFILKIINMLPKLWNLDNELDQIDHFSVSLARRNLHSKIEEISNYHSMKINENKKMDDHNLLLFKEKKMIFNSMIKNHLLLNYEKKYHIRQEFEFNGTLFDMSFEVSINRVLWVGKIKDGINKKWRVFSENEINLDNNSKIEFTSLFSDYKEQINSKEILFWEMINNEHIHKIEFESTKTQSLINEILYNADKNFKKILINNNNQLEEIKYQFGENDANMFYSDLSDGTKKVLQIFSKLKYDSQNANIYAIDEFTNYWQNELANEVLLKLINFNNRNYNFDFIVLTTNSIEFINKDAPNIHFIPIKSNKIEKFYRAGIKKEQRITQKIVDNNI